MRHFGSDMSCLVHILLYEGHILLDKGHEQNSLFLHESFPASCIL